MPHPGDRNESGGVSFYNCPVRVCRKIGVSSGGAGKVGFVASSSFYVPFLPLQLAQAVDAIFGRQGNGDGGAVARQPAGL
jgi:hypothetical protein